MTPTIVVTVDVEEEGLWRGVLHADGQRCRNVLRLPRAHAVCARLGVRPTYLVDHPVASDPDARGVLAELAAGGAAEIGAHLHPWCTPPLVPDGTELPNSYPHQLPVALQWRKLATLLATLTDAFRVRPTTYRAGRWGFGPSSVPVLARAGLTVDTSVKPLWWDPARGGPRFVPAPRAPYRLDAFDVCRAGDSAVVEVPTSAAFVGASGARLERLARHVPPTSGLRRVLRRLGLRTLDAENETLADLRAVVDALATRGVPTLHLTFHSSTLMPGETPYTKSEHDVDLFLARLEAVLEHARGRWAATPLTVAEVPAHVGLMAPPAIAVKQPAAP